MPRLSQWLIRFSLIYLILGFSIGGLLLAHKGIPFYPQMWGWLPAHIEFLIMGWIVQLAMGVAFWTLPRFWVEPRRPNEHYIRAALVLLNVGIWLVVAGTTFQGGSWVLLAGRVLELLAVGFFALHSWRRVVSREGR